MGRVRIERPKPESARDADIRSYPVKAGESVQAGDVVDVVGGAVTAGKVPIGTLAVGSIIKLNVGGMPTEFIVVQHGKPSSIYSDTFNGATVLLMRDCYESRQWNASGANDYANSAIHVYLNSTFLNLLDSDIKSQIQQMKIPYRPGSGYSTTISSGESGLAAKVWLPSYVELGANVGSGGYPADGAVFAYFKGASNAKRIALLDGNTKVWYSRSPWCDSASSTRVLVVGGWGDFNGIIYANESGGVRPAIALPDTFQIVPVGSVRHAIALSSGNSGENIDVLFDGTAEMTSVKAGTSITSPGVRGYSPMDGWIWAKPWWDGGSGIYGTFTTIGKVMEVNVGFRPSLVLLVYYSDSHERYIIAAENFCISDYDGNEYGPDVLTSKNDGIDFTGEGFEIKMPLSAGLNINYCALR